MDEERRSAQHGSAGSRVGVWGAGLYGFEDGGRSKDRAKVRWGRQQMTNLRVSLVALSARRVRRGKGGGVDIAGVTEGEEGKERTVRMVSATLQAVNCDWTGCPGGLGRVVGSKSRDGEK